MPIVISGMFAYTGLAPIGPNLLEEVVSLRRHPAAAVSFALLFGAGWVWLIAGMLLGSARGGFLMLRCWVGLVGGCLIAIGPFALLPHSAMIVVGGALGIAFGSWIATGARLDGCTGTGSAAL